MKIVFYSFLTCCVVGCTNNDATSKNGMDMENKGKCEQIPEWVASMNENPDMLHAGNTPSVQKLSECGFEAAIAILPILDSSDVLQRLRALRVLEGVVLRSMGWQAEQEYQKRSKVEEEFRNLFEKMGNYSVDGTTEQRIEAINKWRKWLKSKLNENE